MLYHYHRNTCFHQCLFRLASKQDGCCTATPARAHDDKVCAALGHEMADRMRNVRSVYTLRHDLDTFVIDSGEESRDIALILLLCARLTAAVADDFSIEIDVKRRNFAQACH